MSTRRGAITLFPMNAQFWRWFYDRVAFAYDGVLALADRVRLGSEARIRREIIAKLELAPRARVLDLGCGTGSSREYLPSNIAYVGIDISRAMLKQAAGKQATSMLVQADASALPFATSISDLTIAMGVFQHANPVETSVSELLRLSKVGGRILVIDESHSEGRIRRAIGRDNLPPNPIGEYFVLDFFK